MAAKDKHAASKLAGSPVQRTTVVDQVEQHLRQQIIDHNLGAEEVLPSTAELAAQFGVSRSMVREALKLLQAKGLVEISNGKRPRVKPIGSGVLVDFFDRFAGPHTDAVIELLELRRGIEVEAAELAAQRRTSDDLEFMWRLVRDMGDAIGNIDQFLDVDVQLHLAIVSAAKNRMLFLLVDSIRAALRDSMREGLLRHTDITDWTNIHASHVSLILFIEQSDVEGAARCMATHFDESITGMKTRQPRDPSHVSVPNIASNSH